MKHLKEPITSKLRGLAVGETAVFPIERYSSVSNVVCKLRIEMSRQGWSLELEKDTEAFEVRVKRSR